jgi:hypothetical protein
VYRSYSVRLRTQLARETVRQDIVYQCYGYPGGRYFQTRSRLSTDDGTGCIDVELESRPPETFDGFSGGGVTCQEAEGEALRGIVIAGNEEMGLLSFKDSQTFQEEIQQARKACHRRFLYFFTNPADSLTQKVKILFPRFIGAPLLGSAVLGLLVGRLDDSYETADAIWVAMFSLIPSCWLFGLFRKYITHILHSMFFCGIPGLLGYYMWHLATCQIYVERNSKILPCPLTDTKYTYYVIGLVFGMFMGVMLFVFKYFANKFLSTNTTKWIGISLVGGFVFLTGYIGFCDIMRCTSPWWGEKYLLFIAVGCTVMSTVGYIADIWTFGLKHPHY